MKNKKYGMMLENGYIEAIFRMANDQHVCTQVISWHTKTNMPIEEEFFADAWVKWDSCSHFRFYGEDYMQDETPCGDGYYHICGVNNYKKFMQTLWFCHEVSMLDKDHIGGYEEKEEMNKNKMFNFKIVEMEWTDIDDEFIAEYIMTSK